MSEQYELPRTTCSGFMLDEVKSALQKSIRRGLEEDALYWAAELSKSDPDILWKRLKVIASEDVGLAYPGAAIIVRLLYENWKESDKNREGRLFVTHAVLALARAKKSRINDHATILAFNGGLAKRSVPDYALDKHTARGRDMSRGFQHFFSVGAKLENVGLEDDPYENRAVALKSKAVEK